MATTQIPWTTGSGNITVTYTGHGNGTIVVTSDNNNLAVDRSQTLTVSCGSITRQVTVVQGAAQDIYKSRYFTLEALESGTFTLTIPTYTTAGDLSSVSYSLDNGATWITTANSSANVTITTPTVAAGGKVLWKGTGDTFSTSEYPDRCTKFSSTGAFNVSGNIMSLLFGDNFQNATTFDSSAWFTFCCLFYGSKVTNAQHLCLPATTLLYESYYQMFAECIYLTTAPEELPATTPDQNCYRGMYAGCTSLTSDSKILATTLANGCCMYMYDGCSSLVTASPLLATQLVSNCYWGMFNGCSSLSYIKALFTTIPNATCTNAWVTGVAASGTFVKSTNATWTDVGTSGVPSGWTIERESS